MNASTTISKNSLISLWIPDFRRVHNFVSFLKLNRALAFTNAHHFGQKRINSHEKYKRQNTENNIPNRETWIKLHHSRLGGTQRKLGSRSDGGLKYYAGKCKGKASSKFYGKTCGKVRGKEEKWAWKKYHTGNFPLSRHGFNSGPALSVYMRLFSSIGAVAA